jgi:hypothetical protein
MADVWFSVSAQSFPKEQEKVVMVIHGGAGTILKSQMTRDREKAYQEALRETLTRGYNILKNGGSALDANEAAVRYMKTARCSMQVRALCLLTKERMSLTLLSWMDKR